MRLKRSYLILISLFFVVSFALPINVKANIMCNDGTTSPSCQDCHRGCCSHHGGCASGYSGSTTSNVNSSSSTSNYSTSSYTRREYVPPKSSDNTLKSIIINGNSISPVNDTNEYTIEGNKANVTAEVNDSKSTYTVNGNSDLVAGNNVFSIVVTAENGS